MAGCLLKLREVVNNLKPSERKVADYLLNHTKDVLGMSIGELAERSGASKAAVIRLCKTLQLDGYRELALSLASEVGAQKPEDGEYTDIKMGDDLATIIKNVSRNNRKSIEDTMLVMDYEEVKKAVAAIHKAKRVDFYGVGASGIAALDAQLKFTRINKFSLAYTDPHMQATAAANLGVGDAAVVISYFGETRDIIETARIAKQSGAVVIAVTKYGRNTLGEMADIKLWLSSPETTIRSGATGSRIAQLNAIDILFSGVASLEYTEVKKHLDKTHKATATKKITM